MSMGRVAIHVHAFASVQGFFVSYVQYLIGLVLALHTSSVENYVVCALCA